ncbi:hypothetical protein [Mycolicibacterium hodleri]|uniref:Uncharacterized protein n=1 Tax=Mycolicibacterium hodleri TaxID=49897 RepID=A0A502EDN5_9MYCO|nr:hypothetical protein [Mycolicibacterium hodleri]TPG34481.1 hypothetical protein EAH80_13115 [Mycolicibacterium hodleri]
MIFTSLSGVSISGTIANADVMSWPLHAAASAPSAGHPAVATQDAILAMKRRTAAATVASVNRGTF